MSNTESQRIRCYCRIRPLSDSEKRKVELGDTHIITVPADRNTLRIQNHAKETEFDRVFGDDSSNQVVYEEVVKELVEHGFKGYSSTLFLYGQTGTGKTYTVTNTEPGNEGMVQRAVHHIFNRVEGGDSRVTVRFNLVQLYRDQVEDLMQPAKETILPDGKKEKVLQRIELYDGMALPDHKNIVTVQAKDKKTFLERYEEGCKNRAIAETKMNKNSSRGHTLLFIYLECEGNKLESGNAGGASIADIEGTRNLHGQIIFADLAGFERMRKTQIEDAIRKDEASSINQSLTSLGKVIRAIGEKDKYIPYRLAKLTRLLQGSLAGFNITSVVVTVNPLNEHYQETQNTVQFAEGVLKVVTQKKVMVSKVDYKQHYIALQEQYKKLQSHCEDLESALRSGSSQRVPQIPERPPASVQSEDDVDVSKFIAELTTSLSETADQCEVLENERDQLMELSLDLERTLHQTLTEKRDLESRVHRATCEKQELEQALMELMQEMSSQEPGGGSPQLALQRIEHTTSVPPARAEQNGTLGELLSNLGNADFQVAFEDDGDDETIMTDAENSSTFGQFVQEVPEDTPIPQSASVEPPASSTPTAAPEKSFFVCPNCQYDSRKKDKENEPVVKNIRIEGECLATRTLWPSFKYSGGEEGECIVKWYKSNDGYTFYEVAKNVLPKNRFYCSADVVHHYIRIMVTPVRKDGVKGKPNFSKLVYINVDSQLDQTVKHMVRNGLIAFHVKANEGRHNEQDVVLQFDCKKLRLLKPPSKDDAKKSKDKDKHQLLFTLPWSLNIQMHCAPNSTNKFFLREVRRNNKAVRVMFSVDSQTDRDVVILAFRAFYCMSKPLVTQVIIGKKDEGLWKSGKWKKLSPDKRLCIMEEQEKEVKPAFPKYATQHRPGCHPTFFHMIEEIYIENELDNTRLKPADKRFPFVLD